MRLPFAFAVFAGSLAVVVACSEDPPAGASSSSSGGSSGSSGSPDSGAVEEHDAGAKEEDASEGGASVLTPTKKTSVDATINQVARTLERAQFGVTKADDTLYLEAHEGGVPECPEEETPKRTMIVRDIPKGAPGTQFTKADGVGVALLDFTGDQIPPDAPKPATQATAVTVTIVNITDEDSVEIEVDATFPEGTAKGRIYATYCAAMNE